ncbi:MAG: HNH endonuclease [Clostridia bacterium]
MKKIDLTGKKFNNLTVISENGKTGKEILWKCKCDCGNVVNVRGYDLKNGHTKSCGCIRKENSKSTIREKNKQYIDKNFVEGTSLSQLKASFKNNTSGHKGVTWDKHSKKWKAFIYFQNKRIYLGNFKDINKAIKAREKAEEEYHKPILEKYQKELD